MNKFSTFEMADLIEVFKNEPILWNKFTRTSRTMPERTKLIENIALRFGKTPGDVEKCWSAMREKYKRERISDVSDVQRKYRKERWELMDNLSFLDQVYGPSPEVNSKKFQVGTIVEILPASSGNNVTVRRIAPKPIPGIPGELVGVGKLKLANLADLQAKSTPPAKAPPPERPKTPEYLRRIGSMSPILLSPSHEFVSEPSDTADSDRAGSPASSIASSTLFPENRDLNMQFKMSRKSRVIRKLEDERRELLKVLRVLTRSKSSAEMYGEYLTKKLASWSPGKQNKAIKLFNKVIAEVEEDE